LFAPRVAFPAQSVTLPLLANVNVLYSPTIVQPAYVLNVPFIASTSALFGPTLSMSIAVPAIGSTSALYPPFVDATICKAFVAGEFKDGWLFRYYRGEWIRAKVWYIDKWL
jgi:hypothetical protein